MISAKDLTEEQLAAIRAWAAEGAQLSDIQQRLKGQFEDMRSTYETRVPEDVRKEKDYLQVAIDNFLTKKRKKLGLE